MIRFIIWILVFLALWTIIWNHSPAESLDIIWQTILRMIHDIKNA